MAATSNNVNDDEKKQDNEKGDNDKKLVEYKPQFSKKYLNIKKVSLVNKYKISLREYGSSSSKCTIAFPTDGISMVKLKYKLSQKNNRINYIGVVPETCNNFDKTAFDGLSKAYGISGQKEFVFKGSGMQRDDKYKSSFSKYCNDNIICLQFDSKKSKLSFIVEKSSKVLYTMKLPTKHQWFPAVSFRNKDDCCEILV